MMVFQEECFQLSFQSCGMANGSLRQPSESRLAYQLIQLKPVILILVKNLRPFSESIHASWLDFSDFLVEED